MNLLLLRRKTEGRATPGTLYIDGVQACYTLEDMVRVDPDPVTPENEAKVYGQTAVPAGAYDVKLRNSTHFGPDTPELLDVPGYTDVLMHGGNTHANTMGCILLGNGLTTQAGSAAIVGGTSRPAVKYVKDHIRDAIARGEQVRITIKDAV